MTSWHLINKTHITKHKFEKGKANHPCGLAVTWCACAVQLLVLFFFSFFYYCVLQPDAYESCIHCKYKYSFSLLFRFRWCGWSLLIRWSPKGKVFSICLSQNCSAAGKSHIHNSHTLWHRRHTDRGMKEQTGHISLETCLIHRGIAEDIVRTTAHRFFFWWYYRYFWEGGRPFEPATRPRVDGTILYPH